MIEGRERVGKGGERDEKGRERERRRKLDGKEKERRRGENGRKMERERIIARRGKREGDGGIRIEKNGRRGERDT